MLKSVYFKGQISFSSLPLDKARPWRKQSRTSLIPSRTTWRRASVAISTITTPAWPPTPSTNAAWNACPVASTPCWAASARGTPMPSSSVSCTDGPQSRWLSIEGLRQEKEIQSNLTSVPYPDPRFTVLAWHPAHSTGIQQHHKLEACRVHQDPIQRTRDILFPA